MLKKVGSVSIKRETGFLRLHQVLARIPVSKSTWWEGVKSGRFPRSIKLGPKITVWRVEDINTFIEQSSGEVTNER